MKIRDRLPLLAVLCCFSALLLLPEVSAQAARDAMLLCAQTLIPSLFPFFVLSSLLIACGASELLSALLSPLMRPLFGLSGTGAAALALGLCGGYPVGARTAAELVENETRASGWSPSATTRDRDFCSACAARACFRPAARARRCISSMSPRRSAQVFSPAARCRRCRMEHIRTKARKRSIFPQPFPQRCRTR